MVSSRTKETTELGKADWLTSQVKQREQTRVEKSRDKRAMSRKIERREGKGGENNRINKTLIEGRIEKSTAMGEGGGEREVGIRKEE